MLFKLAFKNILSRRSSVVIIIFMSFAATLLVVSNAIFDSTEKGVQNSFTASFTGDFVVRPLSDVPLSLFGDETPVTGELTTIEKVVPYQSICDVISSTPGIQGFVSQVSGIAMMEHGNKRKTMSLFGVPSKQYLSLMSGLRIVDGGGYGPQDKGMMISDKVAEELDVEVGSVVQFTIADGTAFRISAATVTGIYTYESPNTIFQRFVLVDPDIVRGVMDIADSYSLDDGDIDAAKQNLLADDLDFDALFSAGDVDVIFEDVETSNVDSQTQEPVEEIEMGQADSTAWNFIICRLDSGVRPEHVIRALNKEFTARQWPVEVVNWRHAAGSTALYLYWMRLIFNIGILIVMGAGFIVVNNTLVVNVLDRTREIGTMRALGASSLFVSLQCMVETVTMTLVSGVIGCVVGVLVSSAVTGMKITFTNTFLMQLFGESALVVRVSIGNVTGIMFLMLCLGVLGWVYPVITTLKVHPIEAIQGIK